MTDLDRLRRIAVQTGTHGLPTEFGFVEDVRWLLRRLAYLHRCIGNHGTADACRFTVRQRCETCEGEGQVTRPYKFDTSVYDVTERCPDCHGTGYQEPVT